MRYTKLWLGLSAVIVLSFAILGYYGAEIYRQAPPVPERVVTTDGSVLLTGQEIKDGQNVWQSLSVQQIAAIGRCYRREFVEAFEDVKSETAPR
jgi:nitric oxide reductase subunit B